MYRSEASRDLLVAVSGCPRDAVSNALAAALRNVAADLLASAVRRMTATRVPLMMIGITVQVFGLFGAPDEARADCASGDGNIATAVTCTVPQVLTGSTGTIVSGAALTTGANTTAYTISSDNAQVTNSGAITSQGTQALLATGSGGTLTNSGSINASQGTAIFVDRGNALNITNTGNIIGGNGTAIDYFRVSVGSSTASSTITQAGGTIQGSILLTQPGDVVNVTGGVINGSISDSPAASGSSGSSAFLGGTLNFDLGAGSFTTNGTIAIGALNVQSGTLVLQNAVSAFLTNNATLQINGLQTLTGDFVQKPSGTLVMQISPTGSSQLKINSRINTTGGTATLAGTLALAYQPGTYQARSYTLISASQRVTGAFSNVTGTVPTPGLIQAVTVGPTDVELTLSGVAQPTNGTILPATATSVVLAGQRMTEILLDRLGARQAGIADGAAAAAGDTRGAPLRLAQRSNIAALGEFTASLPQALTSEGAWFRGIGDFASVSGNAVAPGFNGASGGFLAGFDRPIAPDLYLGLAAGYVHSDLSERSAASGGVDSGRVSAYGGGWWGPSLLTGTTGYAYDRISTARNLSGVGTAAEGHNGHEFSLAGQWSLPTPVPGIAGTGVVTPKIGVQFLHLTEDGFKETGAGGFDLSSRGHDTDSFQPYLGLAASERFVDTDGTEITPEIRLGYNREVLSNNRVITLAAIDGTTFLAQGVKPSRDMLNAGIGVTLRAQDNVLLYANYDAILPTGNTTNHTVSAGLRVRF